MSIQSPRLRVDVESSAPVQIASPLSVSAPRNSTWGQMLMRNKMKIILSSVFVVALVLAVLLGVLLTQRDTRSGVSSSGTQGGSSVTPGAPSPTNSEIVVDPFPEYGGEYGSYAASLKVNARTGGVTCTVLNGALTTVSGLGFTPRCVIASVSQSSAAVSSGTALFQGDVSGSMIEMFTYMDQNGDCWEKIGEVGCAVINFN